MTVVREHLLPNGQDPAILPYRGDARTRVPEHGEGQALALRAAARCFPVARGPVPRDRIRENISSGPLGPACL